MSSTRKTKMMMMTTSKSVQHTGVSSMTKIQTLGMVRSIYIEWKVDEIKHEIRQLPWNKQEKGRAATRFNDYVACYTTNWNNINKKARLCCKNILLSFSFRRWKIVSRISKFLRSHQKTVSVQIAKHLTLLLLSFVYWSIALFFRITCFKFCFGRTTFGTFKVVSKKFRFTSRRDE